jgi:hypothetical protein
MLRQLLLLLFIGCAIAAAPATRPGMESVNGLALPAEEKFPRQDFVRRWRPLETKDHKGTLIVENLRIQNALNQRAMDIQLTSADRPTPSPGEPLTFGSVIIRNCETADVGRDETGRQQSLHVNHIRITGGGERQPFASDVLIEDVYIHGGDAMPLLIQEGKFGRITLRRVKIENKEESAAQITAITSGSVGDIVIEDCPGLKLMLIGRNGSIKRCIVRNSPGAVVNDAGTAIGKSGVTIFEGEDAIAADLEARTSESKVPTTRPAVKLPPPKLVVGKAGGGKKIAASLEGELGEDVVYVTFEAFDWNNYRVCPPVVVTEKPWRAEIQSSKRGEITVQASVTRRGGDPDRAMVAKVNVP